jgi:hypothetical protein
MSYDRLTTLVGKLHAGTLTDDEASEFSGILQAFEMRRFVHEDIVITGLLVETPVDFGLHGLPSPSKSWSRVMANSRLVGLTAIAAIVLLSFFLPKLLFESGDARVSRTTGEVMLLRRGSSINVAPGMVLESGDRLVCSATSDAEVAWPRESSSITIDRNSTLRFHSVDARKDIFLEEGSFAADIAAQLHSSPMIVGTREARAEILGTKFRVQATPVETKLNVEKGRVFVSRHNGHFGEIVEAMEQVAVDQHGAIDKQAVHPRETVDVGLVANWTLDQSEGPVAIDNVRGLEGVLHGTEFIKGVHGNALKFVKKYPEKAYMRTPRLELPAKFCIALWVFVEQIPQGVSTIVSNGERGSESDGFRLFVNHYHRDLMPDGSEKLKAVGDGSLNLETGNGRNQCRLISGKDVLAPNAWRFIVLNVDAGVGRSELWCDGRLALGGAVLQDFTRTQMLQFGSVLGEYSLTLAGAVDEIRIYDRLISESEIVFLFREFSGVDVASSATQESERLEKPERSG